MKLNNFIHILYSIYSLLGIGILIGYYLQSKKVKKRILLKEETIDLNNLVVIIPFRNEENNLDKLIESIEKLSHLPSQFLFINDHSSDNSIDKINQLCSRIPYEILSLPFSKSGKKEAIRLGINHIKCDYILTWDADIEVPTNYFKKIELLPKSDLHILPIKMIGENFKENYFESDHAITNAINNSISGWKRPFIASGANLLFRQESFFKADQYHNHSHIASGDDLFLLRDFREKNFSINLSNESELTVITNSPKTINEFINQRLRWIGKGKEVNDNLSNSLAFTTLIFNVLIFSILSYYIFTSKWEIVLLYFGLKSIIDLVVYLPYFLKIRRLKTWIVLPFYSIIQPIYLITLSVLLFVYQPNWKNRKIQIK